MKPSERRRFQRERRDELARARSYEERPETLDGWVAMFAKIYGLAHAHLSLGDKTLHLMEEVGELEVELRKADRVRSGLLELPQSLDLSGEIADVFSWLATVYSHMEKVLHRTDAFIRSFADGGDQKPPTQVLAVPTFSEWVWRDFGGRGNGLRCHKCDKAPCGCPVLVERR